MRRFERAIAPTTVRWERLEVYESTIEETVDLRSHSTFGARLHKTLTVNARITSDFAWRIHAKEKFSRQNLCSDK